MLFAITIHIDDEARDDAHELDTLAEGLHVVHAAEERLAPQWRELTGDDDRRRVRLWPPFVFIVLQANKEVSCNKNEKKTRY